MQLLKKIPEALQKHINNKIYESYNIYFQDESRFGLLTKTGRMLTARGVQPVCPYHHKFENTYLHGAFSPVTGDAVLLELPWCNTDMFQYFLNHLAKHKPAEFKIVFLDNGSFHKAKRLKTPANIGLVFLPPYSPELNPAELVWKFIKARITNKSHKTLDELTENLCDIICNELTAERVRSITNYKIYTESFKTIYDL